MIQPNILSVLTPLNGAPGGSSNGKTNFGIAPLGQASPVQGSLVSNPIDLGSSTFGEFDFDLMKTNTPIATAMPAGSLQLEVSMDGNGFWPIPAAASNVPQVSAPVAVTAATEGRYIIPFANKSWRYAKVRYCLTGGVTLSAIQAAATTTPASAVQALAITPDELFLGVVTTTAAGFNVYGFAQTTTPLAAAATTTNANLLVGTTAGVASANFCPLAIGAATGNQYYMSVAGGTSPFFSIAPISSAGVMGTVIQPAAGGITAGKATSWHPSGKFVGYCGTTTPFLIIYAFNPASGTLGQAQVLVNTPAVGNATFFEFSPDGNFLLICGATAPFAAIHPVIISADGSSLSLGAALTNPATAVNSAPLCCRWHPRMERVVIANATTAIEYAFYRQAGGAILGSQSAAWGPIVPATTVNGGVVSCRYTPDGSHLLIADTLAGKMFQAWALKDCQTLWNTTVQVGPTVATGITQGNDLLVTPSLQYLVLGGAGGAVFLQTSPWNLGVQMACSVAGASAS